MPFCSWFVSLCLLALLLLASSIEAQEFSTLVDNGSPNNRVDIIILGDGYTQAELDAGLFVDHAQDITTYHFTPGIGSQLYWADPFPRYKNFFNVHLVSTVSNQSGADIPNQDIYVDTALNASFGTSVDRRLTISTSLANNALNTALNGTGVTSDVPYVSVNTTKYGGSGGSYSVYAGANSAAREIALHEAGHVYSDLADEYGGSGTYSGGEPREVNVTADPTGAKWQRWIGFDDPRATNGDLDIGVYEGARYHDQGAYRPSRNSKMRSLNRAFDAVSREKIILDIYDDVDPLDDWLAADNVFNEPLWVDTVDPSVVLVDWYVNGDLIQTNGGESFDATQYDLAAGTYEVRAHAYDEVLKHANQGGLLDLVRQDFQKLQQEVTWSLTIPDPPNLFNAGDYNGDLRVDTADYTVWRSLLGQTVDPYSAADGNGDGEVTEADFAHWRSRYGQSQQSATLIDAQTGNGSFEQLDGASLPRIANNGTTNLNGWTLETTKVGGWNDAIPEAASDGSVYLLAANDAVVTLTSDPLTNHTTNEGDEYSLSIDLGSSDGAAHEFDIFLLFGDNTRLLSSIREDQDATEEGLATQTFLYTASLDDAGNHPIVQIVMNNLGNLSQALLDNIRLDVNYWGDATLVASSRATLEPAAVPEPSSLGLLLVMGTSLFTRRRR